MKYLLALLATTALSQQPLDPLASGIPWSAYLAQSCGNPSPVLTDEAGDTGMFSFKTTCSTGGRGSKPKTYLACWRVDFASDRYTILSRERVLYATWVSGQTGYQCPGI